MLWPILFVLLWVFAARSEWALIKKCFGSNQAGVIAVASSTVTVAAIGVFVGAIIGCYLPRQYRQGEVVTLVNINAHHGPDLYLVVGESMGIEHYYCYQESDGTRKKLKVQPSPSIRVVVTEQMRTDGELIIRRGTFAQAWYWALGICGSEDRYDFYIPRGATRKQSEL